MASALIQDAEAQEAHNFIVGIMQGTVDTNSQGVGSRMQAAQAIIRHWQFQERYLTSPGDQQPQHAGSTSDLTNLGDEELEARVAPIIDFPRTSSTGA